jgi:ubiquitin carboxyl-terminal hydrolase 7
VYSIPYENQDIEVSTTLAMQSVFKQLQFSSSSVSTSELTRAFGWNSADAFQQQDVQEMLRVLIDKLEDCVKGTPQEHVLKTMFAGKIRSYVKCLNIEYISHRDEDFYDIQLDVRGFRDVYESFDNYIAKEVLNKENQYDAGEGRGKQDAEKGVIFLKLPPVLTIHLKRFAFDMQKMCFGKIHDKFDFPSVLDLNRYVDKEASPQESTDVNYVYRLHSVLVHSVSHFKDAEAFAE